LSDITKRQHYVPDFYIRQWVNEDGKAVCHDLQQLSSFEADPRNLLVQQYFYEEDRQSPDNRVEKLLSQMEGACSTTFAKFHSLTERAAAEANDKGAARIVSQSLSAVDVENIKDFAAYQYLRVPGAMLQKEYELQAAPLSDEQKAFHLNPGRFVTGGYSYIIGRFRRLKLLLFISRGQDFITSDWPCFDLKDDANAPLLGEEIGANRDVVAYMALTPRLGAVFYPPDHKLRSGSNLTPSVVVKVQPDSLVRNQNTLVIQQAERFVVARRREGFIFAIAKKRKKVTRT
jgi:hypothetical protein